MEPKPYLDDVGLDRFKQNMLAEIGTALENKVDKIVGKVLSSNDYTDEEKSTVADLKTKMTTLLSDAQTPGSVEYITLNAMLAIIDGAPEDFNTLKEMSDWISTHEDSAATMNSNIQDNARAITALQTGKVDKEDSKGLSSNDFTNADKSKLDGIATGANKYSLPLATASVRGGAKIGYTANGKNYPVQLSNEQMYVNVPWTDTNYGAATATNAGLMSAEDKANIDALWVDKNKLSVNINTDFHTILSSGRYKIESNTSMPNRPSNNGGILDVYQWRIGYVEHIFHEYVTNNIYVENLHDGKWTVWTPVMLSSGGTFTGDIIAPTGNFTNLNVTNPPWTTYSEATTSKAGLMSAKDKSNLDTLNVTACRRIFAQSGREGTVKKYVKICTLSSRYINAFLLSYQMGNINGLGSEYGFIRVRVDNASSDNCLLQKIVLDPNENLNPINIPTLFMVYSGTEYIIYAQFHSNWDYIILDVINHYGYGDVIWEPDTLSFVDALPDGYTVTEAEEVKYVNIEQLATSTSSGLMSAEDKTKLDGLSTDAQTLNGLTAQQIWGNYAANKLTDEQVSSLLRDCWHNNHLKYCRVIYGLLPPAGTESVISFGNGGFCFQIAYNPLGTSIAYRAFWANKIPADMEGWHVLGN